MDNVMNGGASRVRELSKVRARFSKMLFSYPLLVIGVFTGLDVATGAPCSTRYLNNCVRRQVCDR